MPALQNLNASTDPILIGAKQAKTVTVLPPK
jgi:hypothetical protein